MNVSEVLQAANDRTAAEWLAAHHLGVPRLRISEYRDHAATPALEVDFQRLEAGEPLQYILGETEFRGHIIHCDARALIPRPETEELVSRVIRTLPPGPCAGVDVGTGSGCIALSLVIECPQLSMVAIDPSAEALALASKNMAEQTIRHPSIGKRIQTRQASLLDGQAPASLDLLVANLPYIPSATCTTLSPTVKDWEPRLALDGGTDGFELIDQLLQQSRLALKTGAVLHLEVDETHGPALERSLSEYGFIESEIARDFAGHVRFAFARQP